MEGAFTHLADDGGRTNIYSSPSGTPALLFRADLDVNTDGSSRSYHPQDPRGRTRALNNIANAIRRIFDADGADITCSPRRGTCFETFIKTFEAARDAGWNPTGHPRVTTTDMIPWKTDPVTGWQAPCLIPAGPYAGFFVSQTAFAADPTKDACDQARYLDSLTFHAIVLPGGVTWTSQGATAGVGDLAVVRDAGTGKVAFAIVGDTGPRGSIGEGTVALAAHLRSRTLTGSETYTEVRALALPSVSYLIFPAASVRSLTGTRFTQSDVDRVGRESLDSWGGEARLSNCAQMPR